MKNQSGFSLIELFIVISLIGIMSAFAIPNINVWINGYRLKSCTRDLFSTFQLARLTAVKLNRTCTVTFHQPVGGTAYAYVLYVDDNDNLEYDAGEEILKQVRLDDYPNVSFDTTQGGGDGLTFPNNDEGKPSLAYRSNGFSRNNGGGFGSGTAFLKNVDDRKGSVIVSAVGNIRIE